MTISRKLLINSLLTFVGFAAVVLLGFTTITGFRDNIRELTTRSTPLQVKMLQFQQIVERLSGDLLQTGLLENQEELQQLTMVMEQRRKQLDKLNSEIQMLKGVQLDVSAFAALEQQVATALKDKFSSLDTFKAEAANLSSALKGAENSLEGIRDIISGLRSTAARRSQSLSKEIEQALKGGSVTGIDEHAGLVDKVQNYRNGVENDMEISRRVMAAVEAVDSIHRDLRLIDARARMVMLSANEMELNKLAGEISSTQARIRTNLKQAEVNVMSVKSGGIVRDAIEQIGTGSGRATAAIGRIIAAQRRVLSSMAQVEQTIIKVKQTTREQVARNEAHVAETTHEQQNFVEQILQRSGQRSRLMLGGALIIALTVLTLNILVSSGIRTPLNQLQTTIREIAESRDLRRTVAVQQNDEIGQSINAFNGLIISFRRIVGAIAGTAGTLATTSQELSGTVGLITGQVREQSERVAQVAAAGTELSSTVADVASHTAKIADSAATARTIAADGAGIVAQTCNEVRAIAHSVEESRIIISGLHERSNQIGEILDTIREITDQTNLLALNAAIEAARAGEHGLGFAVVANEVRNLARKAEAATIEIGDKLSGIRIDAQRSVETMQNSLERVGHGVQLAEQAGTSLGSIVESVDGLQGMTCQIATATEQLSATAIQISSDILAVDCVLRETLQATDAIAEESVRLASVSNELQSELNMFSYDEIQPVSIPQTTRNRATQTSFSHLSGMFPQPQTT